jgi:hypothetical protein
MDFGFSGGFFLKSSVEGELDLFIQRRMLLFSERARLVSLCALPVAAIGAVLLVPSQCIAISISSRLVTASADIDRNNRDSRNPLSDCKRRLKTTLLATLSAAAFTPSRVFK